MGLTALWALVLVLFIAPPVRADTEELELPSNTISLAVGLPLPVGGAISLELLHRFDQRNFVMLGAGTAVLMSGGYLTYGRRLSPGVGSAWFFFTGVDTNYFSGFFGSEGVTLPGAHVGIGKEWFPGSFRLALSLNTGFPWIAGLRFSVGR
ncbi:MAG: hypothetical protein VYE15_02640 [Myxococcota bacterium]|nr:hypothetical protein [Myxococcota bacterium]